MTCRSLRRPPTYCDHPEIEADVTVGRGRLRPTRSSGSKRSPSTSTAQSCCESELRAQLRLSLEPMPPQPKALPFRHGLAIGWYEDATA